MIQNINGKEASSYNAVFFDLDGTEQPLDIPSALHSQMVVIAELVVTVGIGKDPKTVNGPHRNALQSGASIDVLNIAGRLFIMQVDTIGNDRGTFAFFQRIGLDRVFEVRRIIGPDRYEVVKCVHQVKAPVASAG